MNARSTLLQSQDVNDSFYKIEIKDVFKIPVIFWIMTLIFGLIKSTIVIVSNNMQLILKENYGINESRSGRLMSL